MEKKPKRRVSCIDCERFETCEVRGPDGPVDESRCIYCKVDIINRIEL